ncbi:hypothetical protein FTUN_0048 [Frigoriglobus tundricola]|uniref:Uncharacterized protein n=1 Tax=Frigoriglobus tundricola TaxID=2774151 RepID=A0A6M5YHX3_9BACT|nr:hypothetical protein FTUN_0048 [Frigoriglobus tundricola]
MVWCLEWSGLSPPRRTVRFRRLPPTATGAQIPDRIVQERGVMFRRRTCWPCLAVARFIQLHPVAGFCVRVPHFGRAADYMKKQGHTGLTSSPFAHHGVLLLVVGETNTEHETARPIPAFTGRRAKRANEQR